MITRRAFAPIVVLAAAAAAVLTVAAPVAAEAAPAAPASATPASFSDVPASSGFYGDIAWLAAQDITGGYHDGTFRPARPVSRQAMAAFLYRAENPGTKAPPCTQDAYPDVPKDSPFCGDIAWLVNKKITTGYSDGGFHPGAAVSRQSMAGFLYRLAHEGTKATGCSTKPFPDVATNSTFCGAISWLAGQDITGGYPDGGFHPTAAVSRQSMAAFLHRWVDPAPPASTSRYVRTADEQTLRQAGTTDATADAANNVKSRLHLLQIGAQTKKCQTPTGGVLLSATADATKCSGIRLTYAQLVTLLTAYINAYSAAAPGVPVTIAIGTNSDGDFSTYTARQKGLDWWTAVVQPLRSSAPDVTVVGANDIEPGFAATPAQAANWKTAFLAASPDASLIMNGAADGCPTRFGDTTGSCNHGWTPAQISALDSGARVSVLAQVYLQAQAVQWANIALAGGATAPTFVGTLTQASACGTDGCSWSPSRGWIALWDELTAAGITPRLDYASDLAITS